MTGSFPQVIVHEGPVDAGPNVIVINTRDCQISRGHYMVRYSGIQKKRTITFRIAVFALKCAPRLFSVQAAATEIYGWDQSKWPDHALRRVRQHMKDVRHRMCPRLGLVMERFGLSQHRLCEEGFAAAKDNEPLRQQRKLAQGALRGHRPGVRSYAVELGDADADEIRDFALKHNVSFQEALRTLMQWGLESIKDTVLAE